MATAKSMKIQAEIDKIKTKISEQQARLKELEQKKLEAENSEIVDIVRGMSIPLAELPLLFEKLKGGGALGQSVPKSEDKEKAKIADAAAALGSALKNRETQGIVAAVLEYMERAGRQAGNPRGPARDEQAPGPEFMPNPDIYDEE